MWMMHRQSSQKFPKVLKSSQLPTRLSPNSLTIQVMTARSIFCRFPKPSQNPMGNFNHPIGNLKNHLKNSRILRLSGHLQALLTTRTSSARSFVSALARHDQLSCVMMDQLHDAFHIFRDHKGHKGHTLLTAFTSSGAGAISSWQAELQADGKIEIWQRLQCWKLEEKKNESSDLQLLITLWSQVRRVAEARLSPES